MAFILPILAGCTRGVFKHESGVEEHRKACASAYFYSDWDTLYNNGEASGDSFLATSLFDEVVPKIIDISIYQFTRPKPPRTAGCRSEQGADQRLFGRNISGASNGCLGSDSCRLCAWVVIGSNL